MSVAATRLQVHTAVVSMLSAAFPARHVYARDHKGPQNTEAQNIELFNDDDSILNFIAVRYIGLQRQTAGIPEETDAKIYVFEIEVRRAKNERDVADDVTASETLFNADLDSIENLLENTHLGLDPAVVTAGFVINQPIPRDGEPFNAKGTHVARGQLAVWVGQCAADEI